MLFTGFLHNGPAAVRYPRGAGPGVPIATDMKTLDIGEAEIILNGSRVAILAFGSMVHTCIDIATKLDATLINMRFVKPLDRKMIEELAGSHELLVTVEENAVTGGAGSGVNEALASAGITVPLLNIGIPDRFVEHGPQDILKHDYEIDHQAVIKAAIKLNGAPCE